MTPPFVVSYSSSGHHFQSLEHADDQETALQLMRDYADVAPCGTVQVSDANGVRLASITKGKS